MEHNATASEALLLATQHMQQLLLCATPGKSSQTAAREAEVIANLAFVEGNPVRELFVTAKLRTEPPRPEPPRPELPRTEPERPRSPSPCGTIRPKSSKAFFKFGRGRDKSATASGSSSSSKHPQTTIDGVSPLFEQCFGPIEEKKPKRKERVSDATPPTSSTGTSRGVPVTSFSSQPKPVRVYEQYKCIVCDTELSSKGVCKRHLEDQHITPKLYECEGCHAYFDAKAEAKKHCSQCGDGELSWVPAKLAKKVYACEYTGAYFLAQGRYIDHLLVLSEQNHERPQPSLTIKLDAIIRHNNTRNNTLIPLCGAISQSLFGSPDAWKELKWDGDYLRAKIQILEHATFHPDGSMESARWSGSLARRRNTESYLTQLFQAGKSNLPANFSPGEMSICSTPFPVTRNAPSVASGPSSSAETPLRLPSPMPRSQSRQTVWSPDGMDMSTTASTPRSGDDVMTAELKSKRHLSDESRSYIPARTPPGPPDLLDHYQHQGDTSLLGHPPQLPPLPAFMTPSNSTISLPLRKIESSGLPLPQHMVSSAQGYYPLYQTNPSSSSHTLNSDVSETSTLAQSYQEPELSDVPIDYNLWQQQQLAFQGGHLGYGYNNFGYSMPDDASMVASSINTGNTMIDYVTEIPKMENYSDMDLVHNNTHGGTFYLHDGSGDDLRENEMR